MDPFTSHTGRILPLRRSNVDTDQIIPAVYLKRITRHGFEDGLFSAWRQDPDFVLNRPEYDGASIVVAGPEFGTGSSREHAVWALQDAGIAVVVSPRFADIFRGNAAKAGLLTIELGQEVVDRLWRVAETHPDTEITVDLQARRLSYGAETIDFEVDEYVRWRLLQGLDDIGLTLRHAVLVADYEAGRPSYMPVTTSI